MGRFRVSEREGPDMKKMSIKKALFLLLFLCLSAGLAASQEIGKTTTDGKSTEAIAFDHYTIEFASNTPVKARINCERLGTKPTTVGVIYFLDGEPADLPQAVAAHSDDGKLASVFMSFPMSYFDRITQLLESPDRDFYVIYSKDLQSASVLVKSKR
jgi:hypothetical protein